MYDQSGRIGGACTRSPGSIQRTCSEVLSREGTHHATGKNPCTPREIQFYRSKTPAQTNASTTKEPHWSITTKSTPVHPLKHCTLSSNQGLNVRVCVCVNCKHADVFLLYKKCFRTVCFQNSSVPFADEVKTQKPKKPKAQKPKKQKGNLF